MLSFFLLLQNKGALNEERGALVWWAGAGPEWEHGESYDKVRYHRE